MTHGSRHARLNNLIAPAIRTEVDFMTREHKISLIVGFTLVLLVGVAVSDHLSTARTAELESGLAPEDEFVDDLVEQPIPDPPALDTFAGVPESTPSEPTGPIAKGLEGASAEQSDLFERLRNRIQSFPVAADTLRKEPSDSTRPLQTMTPAPKPRMSATPTTDTWHPVEEGETLWGIAARHYGDGSLAAKLAAYNNADPDMLRAGVRLRIPPRAALTGERPTMQSTPQTTTERATTRPSGTRDYTIQPGDILGVIAQRELGTVKRVDDILELNPNLSDANDIRVGDVIKLPQE
jgi:nucleoid-associated protein YgaU